MRATFLLNTCALITCTLAACAAAVFCVRGRKTGKDALRERLIPFIPVALFALIAVGAFLRLYLLSVIPLGLNQDEASLGYEAYVLATYGTDRYGYPYPVYPVTWGSGGGGPLLIYLMMLPIKLFGPYAFSVRIVPALLGVLTLPVFCLLVWKLRGRTAALFGTLLLALCPWHIMFSRWALDNRPLPLLLFLALLFFLAGTRTKKTAPYLISVVFFALCLYSYGSALLVIPVFLVLVCITYICAGRMTGKQCAAGVVLFVLLCAPLFAFYVVNILDLPEVVTPYFSIEKLRLPRRVFYAFDSALPGKILSNLKYLLMTLTVGNDAFEAYYDFIPGFATLYVFTFPVTFLGFGKSLAEFAASVHSGGHMEADPEKANKADSALFVLLFACAFVFALFVEPDISRLCLLFAAELYFFAVGVETIAAHLPAAGAAVAVFVCAGALLFSRDYFGSRYEALAGDLFMPGYGAAVKYAAETARLKETEGSDDAAGRDRSIKVYSTYEGLNAPYMLALFYDRTSPQEFNDTVILRDEENAEFLIAESFGRFIFGLPEDILDEKYAEDIVIAHNGWDADRFPEDLYTHVPFGHFQVIRRSNAP